MIEMVPVGATVVTLQFRRSCIGRMRLPFSSRAQVSSGPQMLFAHSGKVPRSAASLLDSRLPSTSTNSITRRPKFTPSSVSYAMPSLMHASAKPITPRPIRRMRLDSASISGSG